MSQIKTHEGAQKALLAKIVSVRKGGLNKLLARISCCTKIRTELFQELT